MSLRARIRDGDGEAFEALFEEMERPVFSHAFRLTGNWSAAEDVPSLTFLEAWRLRHRVDAEGGSLRSWVLGIATNVARNLRRAARRYDDALARMPRSHPVPDFSDEIIGRIEAAEQLAAIRQAYGSLPWSPRWPSGSRRPWASRRFSAAGPPRTPCRGTLTGRSPSPSTTRRTPSRWRPRSAAWG
ncbi:sigma factor [Microbispora sp. NPDC088329]|uniref:RNA polymerase sigma factor n=1 Tax=Microbispora sp. NPDC088329 TaxID=3154869 RepID=UPI00341DDFB0